MKKKYVVFLVLVFMGLETMAQSGHLYPTIMPVKENGYDNWEFESFVLGGSLLSQDYKGGLVRRVKQFCVDAGIYPTDENGNPLRTDEDWVRWTYSPIRTWVEDRIYNNGFWNSHQSSNGQKVVLYWDKRPFRGPVLVLHVEGYELDLGKTACANFVKVPYVVKKKEQIPIEQRQSKSLELPKEKVKSKYSDPLPLEDSEVEESILFEEEDSPVVDLKLSKEKNPWLFKSIPNWLEVPLIMAAGYGLYKAGDFAWYHWIKTPKPLPATIWMDPPLDPVVKSFPGVIQPKKGFTLTFHL